MRKQFGHDNRTAINRNPGKYSGSDYLETEPLPWLAGFGYDPFKDGDSLGWIDYPDVKFRFAQDGESGLALDPRAQRASVDVGRVSIARTGSEQLGVGYYIVRPSFYVTYYQYFEGPDSQTPYQQEIAIDRHVPFSQSADEVVSMIRLATDDTGHCRLLAQRVRYKTPVKPELTTTEPWFIAVRAILARAHEVAETLSANKHPVR